MPHGCGVDVAPQGQHLTDAGARSQHDVDDVGHVARGPRTRTMLLLPRPERTAHHLQVLHRQGAHLLAFAMNLGGLVDGVDHERVVAHRQAEHRSQDDLGLALAVHADLPQAQDE
ncbi:hypothetical protein E2C04_08105 [Nocardioides daphniae]|uniref:Uncharacterized protein n=1 Tax=Nocardioides daphniae TaxID=402297 RepID=A0A4P7UCD1_9ACTN|nr:hypothetical protein E2C04_08105 [Nocardioides daphniae]